MAYGVTLTVARSLGEFGAVLVVSGNLIGTTQTATLYIHDGIESFHTEGAYAASLFWPPYRSSCWWEWKPWADDWTPDRGMRHELDLDAGEAKFGVAGEQRFRGAPHPAPARFEHEDMHS